MSLGEPDASGRRRPQPVPGQRVRIPADTAVKAIGQSAARLRRIDGLELDRDRRCERRDRHGRNPKFFAAGDAVNGGASVVEAVAEAKRAARAIDEALR